MKYKTLEQIYHMSDPTNWESEYEMRFNHFSTYTTDININPIQDEIQKRNIVYKVFFCLTKEIGIKTEKIMSNSMKIQNLLSKQPQIALSSYRTRLLINELQSTNEKENIASTKVEIAEALNESKHYNKNSKNKRFIGLVSQYLFLQTKNNYNLKEISDFRKIFDVLVSDEIENKDLPDGINFRTKRVGVLNYSKSKWVHVNEYGEYEIIEFLNKILSFNQYFEAPYLFKLIVIHYLFEYLHPFYDGNGRVGRFIMAKMLSDELDEVTALTFSYTVNRNKNKYDKAFEVTSNYFNKGELTFFISSMLDLIYEGQNSAIENIEGNIKVLENLTNGLNKYNLPKEEASVLISLLEDKVFGSKYSRISLQELVKSQPFGRKKLNGIIKKHKNKLIKIKSRPTTYEISDDFIDQLRINSKNTKEDN
ncbi:Fic family protein [Staphylococcus hominis]|uniref:Fic family protein n=1 Tax=Staphylococcus hominis TaxID=1290 RepID=UPI00019FC37D|nr:Fic family protein [Staphylococcus hominis]EEK12828.1 Fic family protein [Staphylococcus hominis SK119]MCI2859317.1 Fic family protein [Staphylococcus hominis]MDS3840589.1 Fic family protein [Staphylococcus hominis]MDS3855008.1 Fic family protein [Staphylococcus hominis]MDS3858465.1 Fic family protein [Staphylococcus hominis]